MLTGVTPDGMDLRILDALQDDIPLVPRPYAVLAERLGISEQVFLERVHCLRVAGIVRSIAPTLEPHVMGLAASTLVALRVPEGRVHEVAGIISSYPQVSHNFRRDHPFTLWFTLACTSEEEIQDVLRDILQRTGIPDTDVLDLPTVKKLKVDVRFSFFMDDDRGGRDGPA
jgi:DNA-binding Lrp family transcriptional regulator